MTTYCYGIQEGTKEQWDQLWQQYLVEINANELYVIRYGLSCSKDAETLRNYLELTIADEDYIRVQDKHTVMSQVSATQYGRDVAWNSIQDNSQWFYIM